MKSYKNKNNKVALIVIYLNEEKVKLIIPDRRTKLSDYLLLQIGFDVKNLDYLQNYSAILNKKEKAYWNCIEKVSEKCELVLESKKTIKINKMKASEMLEFDLSFSFYSKGAGEKDKFVCSVVARKNQDLEIRFIVKKNSKSTETIIDSDSLLIHKSLSQAGINQKIEDGMIVFTLDVRDRVADSLMTMLMHGYEAKHNN